jgi:hypothetical protein
VAGTRRRTRLQVSPILAALLVGSLVAGIAVTFLSAPAAPNVSGGRGAVPESVSIVLDFSVVLLLALVGGVVLYAALAPRAIRVTGVGPGILSLFLVSLTFLLLVHFVVPFHSVSVPENQTNSTGPGTVPTTNATPPNGTFGPLPISGIPGWTAYIVLGIVVLVAVVFLAPALRARGSGSEAEPTEAAEVRRSLESALESLAASDPTDARQIIIGLYARLLETVGPYLDHLSTATPREIELVATRQFGIAPAPAAQLTRLFEEARYSTHPFTDAQVARARSALEAALLQVKVRSYTGGA